MTGGRIFGREPATIAAFVAVVVKFVAAFWAHVSADQQTWINASVAAVLGLVVAIAVHDGVVVAVLGFSQSALALAVGFGLHWSTDRQAVVMALVAAVAALFVRTQVTAPQPAGSPPGALL